MTKYLSKKEEKQLELNNPEEYQIYYQYARALYEESLIANLSLETRKKLYPTLYKALKIMNQLNHNQLHVLSNDMINTPRPKIYAITHIGKYDIEVISEALSEHTYILSGDFENLHRTFGGTFLELNGIVYVNENDKEDRKQSRETMINILKNGGNIMYFPEGTWNMTPSTPVLQLFPGIIDIALAANAEIIPVAIEQYDHEFIAKIGTNIDVTALSSNGLTVEEIRSLLRDQMATLKWYLYESVPKWDKSQIPNDFYEKFLADRIAEWPGFTLEEVLRKAYKDSEITPPDEAFAHLKKLIPSKENAFLLRNR